MKSKHEQLYIVVQDLLIELGIDPNKLKSIADNILHHQQISPKTARKLIQCQQRKALAKLGPVIRSLKSNFYKKGRKIKMYDNFKNETTSLPKFNSSRKPHICPICNGTGLVEKDFYPDNINTLKNNYVQCRTCKGTGVLYS